MKRKSEDAEVLVRYLLGELPEAERARIEQRFFTDEDYYEQVLAVEDELRYDFVQGRLAPARRASFERRILSTGRDQDGLGFPEALLSSLAARRKDILQSTQRPSESPLRPAGQDIWDRIRARFQTGQATNPMTRAKGLKVAFSVVGIILVAAFCLVIQRAIAYRRQLDQVSQELATERRLRAQIEAQTGRIAELDQEVDHERSRRIELENEVARQNRQIEQMGQKTEPSVPFLSFILSAGLTRDSGSLKRLVLPAATRQVRLELSLREAGEYTAYDATVRTAEGKAVWRQGRLKRVRAGANEMVVLSVPAGVLAPGDYEVRLDGVTPGAGAENVDTYYFTVAKK
jgi:hypothetical protein